MADFRKAYEDLERYVTAYGVRIGIRDMDVEKPGEFDGLTITINPKHDREALCYYLAHSFGSIYQWSTDYERARKVFDELRDAKKGGGPAFEKALENWRFFEQSSSNHAVWVLRDAGWAALIEPYTVFFRADLEAMTIFHRTGKEPRWPDFFAEWKARVASGEIVVEPFTPRPVEPFQPVRIQKQEVLQERD